MSIERGNWVRTETVPQRPGIVLYKHETWPDLVRVHWLHGHWPASGQDEWRRVRSLRVTEPPSRTA